MLSYRLCRLLTHTSAMVAAMAAVVPAGIHVWRRLIRNNREVEAGVALHATLFCGAVFSLIAVSGQNRRSAITRRDAHMSVRSQQGPRGAPHQQARIDRRTWVSTTYMMPVPIATSGAETDKYSRTVPTMAIIASLLLFLTLGVSGIPVIYRRVKRQQDIIGSWDDVQAAESTPPPSTSFGRSFSLRRKKTWKQVTGYLGPREKRDRDGRRKRRRERKYR